MRASQGANDERVKKAYRELAAIALSLQLSGPEFPRAGPTRTLENLDVELKELIDDGDLWYAEFRSREISWIRDGKNVDAEFDRFSVDELNNIRRADVAAKKLSAELEILENLPSKFPNLSRTADSNSHIVGDLILISVFLLVAFLLLTCIRLQAKHSKTK